MSEGYALKMFSIPKDEGTAAATVEDTTLQQHSTELDLPVFSEDSTVVTTEPKPNEPTNAPPARRPIPVSTIDWRSTTTSQFIPMNSLDFLVGVDQLYIQQTVELNDLLSNMESENRYTVKVPRGETLYYATETSTSFQRSCFGSSRAFSMRLYDQTQQEAMQFKRRLACGSFSFCCYLQQMEVWIPPGELVGEVIQEFGTFNHIFNVCNRHRHVIYRIEGPKAIPCMMYARDIHFKIYSADGATQLGSINYQWDQMQSSYYLCLQFPGQISETRHKALLLGAAFLFEYLYFEGAKRRAICKCIC